MKDSQFDQNVEASMDDLKTFYFDVEDRHVFVAASSVIGRRKEQQDAIKADTDYDYAQNNKMIATLCDGMGGLSGGERASALCSSIVHSMFHDLSPAISIPQFYRMAIDRADREVSALRGENGTPLKAGTTMASVVIDGNGLYWASVGDSRIYILRENEIQCITRDHNFLMLLNEKVKRGEITQEEADGDPKREALVSYIGCGCVRYIDSNSRPLELMDGDNIVLCSDGLYRSLSPVEIWQVVNKFKDNTEYAAQALTDVALSKGNPYQDNTSVVVLAYCDPGNRNI